MFLFYLGCLYKVFIWNQWQRGHQDTKFHSVEIKFKRCEIYFLFMQRLVDSMNTQQTCAIAMGKYLKSNNPVDSIISWTAVLRQENRVTEWRRTVLWWMVIPKSNTSCLPNIRTFIKLLYSFHLHIFIRRLSVNLASNKNLTLNLQPEKNN